MKLSYGNGPMIWHELDNFSSGAICLVLASRTYNEADYIRDHGRFLEAVAPQSRRDAP
jgi:hypothetical protein